MSLDDSRYSDSSMWPEIGGGNQKYFFLNPDLRVVFGPVHVVAPSKKTPGGLGNACGILEHGAGY